jgi:hypothetical protein
MKDFDTERKERHAEREATMGDRTFILGGETFSYRATVSYTVLERIAASSEQDGAALIRALEEAVIELLEEGQQDRFLAVIRSTEDPLSFSDLNDLCTWLTEAQVNRPTLAPLPSTAGDAKTSTSSTDDSSSPPAAVSAA